MSKFSGINISVKSEIGEPISSNNVKKKRVKEKKRETDERDRERFRGRYIITVPP